MLSVLFFALQASSTVDLTNLPSPYPLPYGEYLGEVEAVHLILAHDLYNELREIVRAVQELGSSARDGW